MAGFLIHSECDGNISQDEADRFLTLYKEGLDGYTYLIKPTLEWSFLSNTVNA
jgi:arginine decarboxylase